MTDDKELEDEIVAEVRRARENYAAAFNYDLDRIIADLENKSAQHPDRQADIPPVVPDRAA